MQWEKAGSEQRRLERNDLIKELAKLKAFMKELEATGVVESQRKPNCSRKRQKKVPQDLKIKYRMRKI